METNDSTLPEVKLKACDIKECEGLCCYDGVYLRKGDEERIDAAVAAFPEYFKDIAQPFIVLGNWRNVVSGRKTNTRPWTFSRPIPSHFANTRCIFAGEAGLCRLETVARANGLHPWTFKPTSCYLFPLHAGRESTGPDVPGRDSCDMGEEYPGYPTLTDCGRHRPDGRPWAEVLGSELQTVDSPVDNYFQKWRASMSMARNPNAP